MRGATGQEPTIITVVPCFNEARRLDGERLLELAPGPAHRLLLVNDGSTDETAARLDALSRAHPARVLVRHLPENRGKAEAVRAGLLEALSLGATAVGYFDADLATPPSEMLRLYDVLHSLGVKFVLASRVALLGREIERTPRRHYLGRVFATLASVALGLRVYDTQCGAKAMLVTPELKAALATPFSSRWVFDVELLMRLLSAPGGECYVAADFAEMPLRAWNDVKGSKLSSRAMAGAATDLARLALEFGPGRRRRGP